MDASTRASGPVIVAVASAVANEIAVYHADPVDCRLEILERLALPGGVTPLAMAPDRRFLFAGLRGTNASAVSFAVDRSSGKLAARGTAPLAAAPMYLAVDGGGNFLLSASYADGSFAINAVRSDGTIEAHPLQVTATPPQAHCILTDPANRYLFVTALGGDVILQYVFDARTGRALPNAIPSVATPPGSGPRHAVFHPSDSILYVNGELDGSICSFALSVETGQLHALRCASMLAEPRPPQPWAGDLAVSPDGRHLYASERRTSRLAIFDLAGEPGALRCRETLPTEEQPRSLAVDPRGRFLIVAGERSHHISLYGIDPADGALAARFRYKVGEKPVWVSIYEPAEAI